MTADTGSSPGLPVFVATLCLAIVVITAAVSLAGSAGGGAPVSSAAQCPCMAATLSVPAVAPVVPAPNPIVEAQAVSGPVIPEHLASADLELTQPPAADLVPYTARNFSQAATAAIAWWMSPGFMDNTSEFRRYERSTAEQKAAYPEEHRIFFEFIQDRLDEAEGLSVLTSDVVLFRGIGPGLAAAVLDNAEYREPAFASTSYDITLSLDDFTSRSPDGYRNIIVLERQAGDNALYINEDEREFLLPRKTSWHVIKSVNVENLTVKADFLLHNRTTQTTSFDHVRLIYVKDVN
ncbi:MULTISPECIES: hypothetical protein [unclassified Methanoregula]|uniref:hypothetical protein n=1 Tax=unclassified Methanoregula TaxID=2649730 RepID=UPI0009D49A75|nr:MULTISPECIES: hypothetical protein [unclassified Methanoregula]OPX64661.1 MAG: hypothetical protein A4E33_00745 [Methanoregula sp. PtaB.Bin085]OPY36029.1 MAG: hypothetical protein A4E34_00433 [Methanoregula sp. PtaU1.Bin006]